MEVAYFHQAITKSRSVPYLDTSMLDLLTHILNHVLPIPQLSPEQ